MASNGLMTSNGGRATVEYLAKCALSNGDYIDKQDQNGTWYRYYGRLGIGAGWKSGACDTNCQQRISACMMAHMNSTGNHVPIFVNADAAQMPSVGMSMPYASGSDAAIQEGVFFGNMLANNPPQAFFVKGNAFKASIPGRLGASTSNPYKPFEGYRVDEPNWYSARADKLCYTKDIGDGEHVEYHSCQAGDWGYGPVTRSWPNVMTTYVNNNYNGAVSQNFAAVTFNFDSDAVGTKTNSPGEVWTRTSNFDFSNSVHWASMGRLEVQDNHGGRRLCPGGDKEHVVITKNGGEPFSLTTMRLNHRWNGGAASNVTVTGYVKGSSTRKQISVSVPPALDNASTASITPTFSGWDNLLKVEIRQLGEMICVDDLGLKS